MIRYSVNIHRGCFGGCSFCAISAHQGKFVSSRSKESILNEVRQITEMHDFKGYISDLGGPSANMYGMKGFRMELCEKCKRPSCIYPKVCSNLNADHTPLLDLYKEVNQIIGIKKIHIGSGIRHDLLFYPYENRTFRQSAETYATELITHHVSGRLKVAPEHTSDQVLNLMRKPAFHYFHQLKRMVDTINRQKGLKQQLIPYFISSHPGCTETDMAELAITCKSLRFSPEQIQDFTPTPMTLSTEMYYTGYHPETMLPLFTARNKEAKLQQRRYFFWYKEENKSLIVASLSRLKRKDLINKLYSPPPSLNS